jgi:hypothetical protein
VLDDEQYRTRWTDRVVLVDDIGHLLVMWCEHATPRDVEQAIIQSLRTPLNVQHASGPARELVQAARRRYFASAVLRTPA